MSMMHILGNMTTASLILKYKLEGPSYTLSTACASGASAIGQAFRAIQNQ